VTTPAGLQHSSRPPPATAYYAEHVIRVSGVQSETLRRCDGKRLLIDAVSFTISPLLTYPSVSCVVLARKTPDHGHAVQFTKRR